MDSVPDNTPLGKLLARLPGARRCGTGWSARCPAHDDSRPSLTIGEGDDGRALVSCKRGCTPEEIVAALELTMRDLFPDGDNHARRAPWASGPGRGPKMTWDGQPVGGKSSSGRKSTTAPPGGKVYPTAAEAVAALERQQPHLGKHTARWEYHNEAGEVVGLVVRFDPPEAKKEIRPASLWPDGWRVAAMPDPRPLYGLPTVTKASRVIVTEGEKAADAARGIGFTATTSAGGSQAAGKTDWTPLAGKEVWVLPDNDTPGRKYAEEVARILRTLDPPAVVKIIELPGLPEAGDLADWIDAHGDAAEPAGMRDEIEKLAERVKATPGGKSDGWGPAAPLPTMPPVPPFPVGAFPAKVANYWQSVAAALAVPLDYVAVPGMTLLGAALGRSTATALKRGYHALPCFWSAVIAPPGSTKSAALGLAGGPLRETELKWMEEHRKAVGLFDAESERWNVKVKEWKAGGCEGEPPQKPTRPVLRQAILDDATVEAAAKVMSDNPRGIVIVKDELTGFVNGLNQYRGGKGADREFWLSGWTGAPAKKNRAGSHEAGPLHVPHPFVAVTGMLCPDMLPEIRGDLRRGESQADGFADRFLWSFPDPADAVGETWAEVPEDLERGYAEVMADLLGKLLVTEQDGAATRERPYFVTLDGDARAAWERFTTEMARQMNDLDKFDPFRGVLSKLKGYTLRFSALLWALRRICGELSPSADLDAETLRRSVRLTDYFRAHGCRALGVGWADRPNRVARRLLAWLARNPDLKAFTRSQAFIALKDQRSVRTSEALEPVFRLLVDHHYLRPLDATGRSRPGPVPETYLVNPGWVRDAAEYAAGADADAG